MTDKIDSLIKQTQRYYYDDGLVEMIIGLFLLITGLMLFAWSGFGQSPIISVAFLALLLVTAVGGSYLVTWLIRQLKQRATYPRTGYVAYRQSEPSTGRWIIPLVAFFMVIALFLVPEEFNNMATMVGGLLAAVLIVLGYRLGLRRFYLLGILSLVVGAALARTSIDEFRAVAITFIADGGMLFLTGLVVLVGYLRQHPKPQEELS